MFCSEVLIPLHNRSSLQWLQLIQHFNFNLQLAVFLSGTVALLQKAILTLIAVLAGGADINPLT